MNTAERKIKTALDAAVGFKNKGVDPTEAVSKAASLSTLNPDMTERLVEAFNIALTNATLKVAKDKTASFPLADRDKVMKNVFEVYERPTKEASLTSETGVEFKIEEGDIDLSWMYGGTQKIAAMEDPTSLVRRAIGVCENAEHELSKEAQNMFAASQEMERHFVNLHDIMTESEFLGKFAAFEMQALSEYGDEVAPVIDNIYGTAGLDRFGEPRFVGKVKIASEYFPQSRAYSTFELLMDATSAYKAACISYGEKLASYTFQAEETKALLHEAVPETAPLAKKVAKATDLLGESSGGWWEKSAEKPGNEQDQSDGGGAGVTLPKISPPFDRGSGLLPSSWSGVAGSLTDQHQQAHGEAVKRFYKGPKEEVDMEMDNVRRQAILRELMANDEIISKVQPKDIERSYNTLLTTAPNMTLNPAIVQGWLRQSSATQAVDPFTAKQLIDLQKGSLQNKALEKGEKMPMN